MDSHFLKFYYSIKQKPIIVQDGKAGNITFSKGEIGGE
jgi:hypothetical protein